MTSGPPRSDGRPGRFEAGISTDLPAELAMARLPTGRHGLSRDFVARNQRTRIVAGMLRVLPRRGYPATTIGDVTAEAGVSRAAFYAQFASKEECFLATYDVASGWVCGRVEEAVAGSEGWAARIRAGAAEAFDLLASHPAVAHLIAIEAPQAGPSARERQRNYLARIGAALRPDAVRGEATSDLEQLLLGGTILVIARYVDTGRAERLSDISEELVERLLVPLAHNCHT